MRGSTALVVSFIMFSWLLPSISSAHDTMDCGGLDAWELEQTLNQQQEAYYNIGTDRDAEIADIWNDVAYGFMPFPVTVGGVTYSPTDIHNMSEDERVELANGLANEYGLLDDLNAYRDEQAAFLADPANKEYAQYETWLGEVRDHENGVDAYWLELIEENENAAIYYKQVEVMRILPAERERLLTGIDAFLVVTGIRCNTFVL